MKFTLTFSHVAPKTPPVGLDVAPNATSLPPECNQISIPALEVMSQCMPSPEELAKGKYPQHVAADRLGKLFKTNVAFRGEYRGNYQFQVGVAKPVVFDIPE